MIRAALLAAFIALLSIAANAQSTTTIYAGLHLPLNGTQATTQEIGHAAGITGDGAGGFYFSSCLQHRVYRVTADGILTIVAGDGLGGDGGPAESAALRCPSGLALDASGNLYVADRDDNRVRKVAAGVITTVAGTGVFGFSGDGGPATSAQIGYPEAIAVDKSGNVYISNSLYRVRRIASDGTITTVAGTGVWGVSPDGGMAVSSALTLVGGLAVDSGGNLLIAAEGALRKVGVDGKLTTIANGLGFGGLEFFGLRGIAIDATGNVFVSDSDWALDAAGEDLIRMISPAGVVTTVAGSGASFQFSGDGGPATAAALYGPQGIALDTAGNLLIADWGNRRIRKVVGGIINTVAGRGPAGIAPPGGFSGDGGPATFAELNFPAGMAVDAAGNLFIADSGNNRIRRVSPDGIIDTVAGSGVPGFGGDGGPATAAMLNKPLGVAVDHSGNLFIADKDNNRIRKVTPDGKIATVLSVPYPGPSGIAVDGSGNLFVQQSVGQILKVTPDGVISTIALGGWAIAPDSYGNLFVADYGRVRRIDAQGIVTTVAGNGHTESFGGDGGAATATGLDSVSSVAVDAAGNLFIAAHFRIRMVSPDGIISTVEQAVYEGSDFGKFDGVAADGNGNLYISDYEGHHVRLVRLQHPAPILTEINPTVAAPGTSVAVTLTGTDFYTPLTLDAGAGISIANSQRIGASTITATLMIASNAALGMQPVTVTTSFGRSNSVPLTIVPPFPDLAVTSIHNGDFHAGFETTYTLHVYNVGSAPTGPITLTDSLPSGFAYVSGTGSNWSCTAAGQTVSCGNATPLAAGDSTDISVKVAVGRNVSSAAHSVTVSTGGDHVQNNNTVSDPIQVLAFAANAQSTTTIYAGLHLPLNGTQATTQEIGHAAGIVGDGAGGFYFSSCLQHRVYRVNADGILTIVVGDGLGGDGGPAASAALRCPSGLARDASGSIYIADRDDHRVRKVTAGVITTVAGTGGSGFSGDGGPAISAQVAFPEVIAVDQSGNIYVSYSGARVRRIAADGTIMTVAGNGVCCVVSPDGGMAVSSALIQVGGLAVDSGGNLLIATVGKLRKVGVDGKLTTIADGIGFGGPAFGELRGIAIDAAGNVFVSDSDTALDTAQNGLIRMISPAGVVTTVAGSGAIFEFSGDGGPATAAALYNPQGVALDTAGNLLIADWGNRRIRKVVGGIIDTVAGRGPGGVAPPGGFSGDGGPATFAELNFPAGMAVDAAGNLFITDSRNNRIRRVSPDGIIDTVAGSGVPGFGGDGGPATAAMLNRPRGVAVDRSGNLFIADTDNNRIRKVTPDGKIATVLSIAVPAAIAVDGSGNLFTAGLLSGSQILKVTPDGVIRPITGAGSGFSGDGGPALLAKFISIEAIAADNHGNLFVADANNLRIRRIDAQGIVTTVAGNGNYDFSGGDGVAATSTGIGLVSSVAVDDAGNLFIAAYTRIRMVSPGGIISTVERARMEGSDWTRLDGVAVDGNGNLYISDYEDHHVRLVRFQHPVPILTEINPTVAVPGTSVAVTLTGTDFYSPLTFDAGAGISITDSHRIGVSTITATLMVASNAALGLQPVTVTTSFGRSNSVPLTIVPPFPDLEVTSTHDGDFRAGFDTTYTLHVHNVGSAPSGPIILTDFLPSGFAYVSGTGSNWTCAAAGQTVSCGNATPLAAGDSADISVKVAVGSNASSAAHSVTVSTGGDHIQNNNTLSDSIQVPTFPKPALVLNPLNPTPGKQATVGVSLSTAYPYDLSGVVSLNFASDSIVPGDDPAVQFATGGRTVSFTIPANTLQARFGGGLTTALPFQTGTVAGTATLSGFLQTGAVQTDFSTAILIPRQPPSIQSVQNRTGVGFGPLITLTSTPREITAVTLQFDTKPGVRLSCGSAPGCAVSGSTLTFDVQALFDTWFTANPGFGGVTAIYVPLSIQGQVSGKVWVTLRNSSGASIPVAFPLP